MTIMDYYKYFVGAYDKNTNEFIAGMSTDDWDDVEDYAKDADKQNMFCIVYETGTTKKYRVIIKEEN